WVTPCGPSEGSALTRLSYGGSGYREAIGGSYVDRKHKTDVRMLPQFGPLESLVADKLGGVHETDQGGSAACHPCRGERARNVRLAPSPPLCGGGRPLRATESWGVGGHALLAQPVPSASHSSPCSSWGFPGRFL